MKRRLQINEETKKEKVMYCTECGETLENYCFTEDVSDIEAIKTHHENCKSTQKFKGDYCSRVFIAEPTAPPETED